MHSRKGYANALLRRDYPQHQSHRAGLAQVLSYRKICADGLPTCALVVRRDRTRS